jgi:hypothetical protein
LTVQLAEVGDDSRRSGRCNSSTRSRVTRLRNQRIDLTRTERQFLRGYAFFRRGEVRHGMSSTNLVDGRCAIPPIEAHIAPKPGSPAST